MSELIPLLRIAGPVILAEVGWMSMGIVDTIMVGPLGPAAIGAAGMGSSLFTAIAIFGMGLMLGLDTFVSQAHGANDSTSCRQWLHSGVWLALLVTPFVMGLAWLLWLTLDWWGLHPQIRPLVSDYLRVISFGALPLLLYAALRRYLQGMHVVRPIMFALVSANLVNAGANWVLIYGHLGMPALGVEGSAWSTTLARIYMALFLYVAILIEHRRRREHIDVPLAPDAARVRRLVTLGFPAASQVALEVGVFAAATALAGRLEPVSSGSHQIALNIASLAFMVPLGLASSGAVRVGHAVGARDLRRAVRAGWTALATGGVVMTLIGLVLFAWPAALIGAFTTDPRIIQIGVGLLAIAAAFQLFDGTQAVATGVLRGVGETRMPMLVNVVGHWVFGLPVGYALCFHFAWGVAGLWIGLSIGLVFTAVVLVAVWWKRTRVMQNAEFGMQK
ncbi:MAG TPA: MATE family efflux transporter [Vicinamibacterales bacterium]|nr:MATE family efflux transporter [Vicinamibacterales bacterium]